MIKMKNGVLPILAAASRLLSVSAASAADSMSNNSMMSGMDRYGGPTYRKSTDLPTTIAFINAGGGPPSLARR
jgi:hypothetical protein